ncbi:hypothetical protein [Massilibacteroides sp.]|uniref:hypothetical protein n=1 Tax=Massilibacteroides sp. TaxID=2034766 RepID=UPI00261BCB70|nr:hypothetical protein [Massilibacteroides sp.]MDD4516794.1 hypothetical protein [Massilibacteroides sp.]
MTQLNAYKKFLESRRAKEAAPLVKVIKSEAFKNYGDFDDEDFIKVMDFNLIPILTLITEDEQERRCPDPAFVVTSITSEKNERGVEEITELWQSVNEFFELDEDGFFIKDEEEIL